MNLFTATPEQIDAALAAMTREQRAEWDALMALPSDNYVTMQDLKIEWLGQLVPLVANPPQRLLMEELGLDPDAPYHDLTDRKLRVRILKARREGISTLVSALFFLDTYNNANRNTAVVAHREDSAGEIFAIYKRFYDNLPKEKKVKAQKSGAGELLWADRGSRITVATAGGVDIKSGATLHNLHKSEYAKWTGDVAAVDASLNIAARWGNIIEETTAKGLNYFYAKWQESVGKIGAYVAIFLAWFLDPRNVSQDTASFVPTEKEATLQKLYNLSKEQMQWYREQAVELKELMPQEYPFSAEEAFIASGNPYFKREPLLEWIGILKKEEFQPLSAVRIPPELPFLQRAFAEGQFKIWEWHKEGNDYIISADPAGGVNVSGDSDFCSASVINVQTRAQVAHLHGRWEPHIFGNMIDELYYFFGLALVAVHRKNHGLAVLQWLLHDKKIPAQKGMACSGVMFYNPAWITETKSAKAHSLQPGWDENSASKPFMMDKLGEAIEQDTFDFRSVLTVEECLRYVHLPGFKSGAEAGAHDDCVSEIALGVTLLSLKFERRREWRRMAQEDEQPEPAVMWDSGRRR
jgi:hypothetical protein